MACGWIASPPPRRRTGRFASICRRRSAATGRGGTAALRDRVCHRRRGGLARLAPGGAGTGPAAAAARLPAPLAAASGSRAAVRLSGPRPALGQRRGGGAQPPRALGALSWDVLRPLALEGWEERQRQQVAAAARGAASRRGPRASLGEALERVACDAAAEHDPLVIDAAAFEEAGLTPGRALALPADAGRTRRRSGRRSAWSTSPAVRPRC